MPYYGSDGSNGMGRTRHVRAFTRRDGYLGWRRRTWVLAWRLIAIVCMLTPSAMGQPALVDLEAVRKLMSNKSIS